MTPDELAAHLSDIAKEHGASLTEIAFMTHSHGVVGNHSYRAIISHRLDKALPDTFLVNDA